ncbi:MAG: GMP synthase (glutamine-hydrolyzing), partial [Flavobacteriales bacterium]
MQETILILDFGSQYTQLIARRVRELNIYCEIHPYNEISNLFSIKSGQISNLKGIILSGSPFSVCDNEAPIPNLNGLKKLPVLGVCYGAQWLAQNAGGTVEPSSIREYGRANLSFVNDNLLLKDVPVGSQVWMSHGDTIQKIPDNFKIIASTNDVKVAGYQIDGENTFGIQFHPEVYHST